MTVPGTSTVLTYRPATPGVMLVRFRLFADPAYSVLVFDSSTGPPPVLTSDGSYAVSAVLDDGTYFSSATLNGGSGTFEDRSTDDLVVVGAQTSQSLHGPCPWPWNPLDFTTQLPVDPVRLRMVKAIAQEILWRASGRRFGICTRTIRPCRPGCSSTTYRELPGALLRPALIAGTWVNCGSCGCGGSDCNCCSAGQSEVRLPAPIQSIASVRIDGALVPATSYEVHDHQWLVRTDGKRWPSCQDMSRPSGAVGTWQVTFSFGLPLGAAGIHAYAVYALELYRLISGERCRLPAKVEGIFRQGVNVDFSDDNLDLLSKGRTGLTEVDAWLASVNPYGIKESARVYSVDRPAGRQVTILTATADGGSYGSY